ncbi:DUF1707 SHOCT-like domain-containing protein [Allosaccharopolyspora coralli]|nr:DUF1707 domain-containing protein [Allosaccharopolyspora coralli]
MPTIRVSDADRRRVGDRLQQAVAEGRIELAEFDERVRLAWAAQTADDLARLTADLPEQPSSPATTRSSTPKWMRMVLRTSFGAWLLAVAVNVVIWALVSVGVDEPVHPWWIWVAGPWGAVLLAGALAGRLGLVPGGQCSGRLQR